MNDLKRVSCAFDAQQLRENHKDKPPIGEQIKAILKGKSWGKSMNLLCYFSEVDTSVDFTLSVFRNRTDSSLYSAPDNVVNFSDPEIIGNTYILSIHKSVKAKFPSIKKASLVSLNNELQNGNS